MRSRFSDESIKSGAIGYMCCCIESKLEDLCDVKESDDLDEKIKFLKAYMIMTEALNRVANEHEGEVGDTFTELHKFAQKKLEELEAMHRG